MINSRNLSMVHKPSIILSLPLLLAFFSGHIPTDSPCCDYDGLHRVLHVGHTLWHVVSLWNILPPSTCMCCHSSFKNPSVLSAVPFEGFPSSTIDLFFLFAISGHSMHLLSHFSSHYYEFKLLLPLNYYRLHVYRAYALFALGIQYCSWSRETFKECLVNSWLDNLFES